MWQDRHHCCICRASPPQHHASTNGGLLARIKAVGRRVASVAAAASSVAGGSTGARSGFWGRDGGKSRRLTSGSASLAVRDAGPVAEALERGGAGGDHAVVVRGGATAASGSVRQPGLRRRGSAGGSGSGHSNIATCAGRLPRGGWVRNSAGVMAPEAVSALGSFALGAPPPPFVFPNVCNDAPTAHAAASDAAQWQQEGRKPEQQLQAHAHEPAPLLDLLVAAQRHAEAKQERLDAQAAAVVDTLMPWHRWRWLGGGSGGSGVASERAGGSSQQGGRAAGIPAGGWAQAEEDGSYSWPEFFDILAAIGLTPGPGSSRTAAEFSGLSIAGTVNGPAVQALSARSVAGNTRHRAAVGAGPVAEGVESGVIGSGAARRSVVPSRSFHDNLASLIAEAEEMATSRLPSASGNVQASMQRTLGSDTPGVEQIEPGAAAGSALGLSWRGDAAVAEELLNKDEEAGDIDSSRGGEDEGAPAPQPRWARLQDEASPPGSARLWGLAVQPHSPPLSARHERGHTPRPAHIRFQASGDGAHVPPADGAASAERGPAFLEAALASLRQVPAQSGGGGAATTRGAAGGGVRFADNVASAAASKTNIGVWMQ